MSIYFEHNEQFILIQGQTYPHRTAIRSLGATFCGQRKLWQIKFSNENLSRVKELCSSLGNGVSNGDAKKLKNSATYQAVSTDHASAGEHESYTIAEVMSHAANLINQGFPNSIWIIGEIQNLQQRREVLYFDFAEADSGGSGKGTVTIKATIWKSSFERICGHHGKQKIQEVLQDGMKIRCLCQVSIYKGRGQLSLNILNIDPKYTKGALALAREALLSELRLKGLDKTNKKLKLPAMPLKIGLLSAPGSRALSDFTHQLHEGKFPGELVFLPCSMQGEKVCKDVVNGIAALTAQHCDLIVVTRGGGSAADLRWFDMPELAYAIAHSPVPIVAAIGHHDDFCVAEEICFNRQKTPTAAADFIVQQFTRLNFQLEQWMSFLHSQTQKSLRSILEIRHRLKEKLAFSWQNQINKHRHGIMDLNHGFGRKVNLTLNEWGHGLSKRGDAISKLANNCLEQKSRVIEQNLIPKMNMNSQAILHHQFLQVEKLSSGIHAKDPAPWMQRGFTILESSRQKINSINQIDIDENVQARLLDGLVELRVIAKTNREKKAKI
ncbi:MAG: exodeoxyribonuclease VII large subunit [Oligoflexales bacterium]